MYIRQCVGVKCVSSFVSANRFVVMEGSVLVGGVRERERSVLVGAVRERERRVLEDTVTERERSV